VRVVKWLVLVLTMLFFVYIYVEIVLNWWNYWKKKFLFGGDIENYLMLTVLGFIVVQIMKYVWKLEVRLFFR